MPRSGGHEAGRRRARQGGRTVPPGGGDSGRGPPRRGPCSSCGSSRTASRAGASARPWPRAPRSTLPSTPWRRPRSSAGSVACERPARHGTAGCPSAAETAQLFGTRPVDRLLAATFEMAVADLELRATGESLAQSIGVTTGFEAIAVGGFVGIPPERELSTLRRSADLAVARGLHPPADEDRPRAGTSSRCASSGRTIPTWRSRSMPTGPTGPRTPSTSVAWPTSACSAWSSRCLRPTWPLRPSWRGGCRAPVCLDESLSSLHRVRDALRYGSCPVACLKPARLGGLRGGAGGTRRVRAPPACPSSSAASSRRASDVPRTSRSAARLQHGRSRARVGDLDDPADYLEVDPVATRPSSTDGSGCPRSPASAAHLTREFSTAWRRGVVGFRPPTLDGPCIEPSWNGGSATRTPAWCGRVRSSR